MDTTRREVGFHHLRLRGLVAGLDPLRQINLLRRGEQRHAADVLKEQLQGVGGLLHRGLASWAIGLLGDLRHAGRGLGRLEQLDTSLVELLVDVLGQPGVHAEQVEHVGDVLDREEAHLLPPLQQGPELTVVDELRQLRE